MNETVILKVASSSESSKVAGSIVALLKENKNVQLHALGAGAVNQASKAIAIARGYIASSGVNLYCIPAFIDVEIENESKSGIKFIIKEEK